MAAADSAASSGGVRTARPAAAQAPSCGKESSEPPARASRRGSAPTVRSTPARSWSTDSSATPRSSSRRPEVGGQVAVMQPPAGASRPFGAEREVRPSTARIQTATARPGARMIALLRARAGPDRFAGTHACRRKRSPRTPGPDDRSWEKRSPATAGASSNRTTAMSPIRSARRTTHRRTKAIVGDSAVAARQAGAPFEEHAGAPEPTRAGPARSCARSRLASFRLVMRRTRDCRRRAVRPGDVETAPARAAGTGIRAA